MKKYSKGLKEGALNLLDKMLVREHKEKYTVKEMCKVLNVSESGYYR